MPFAGAVPSSVIDGILERLPQWRAGHPLLDAGGSKVPSCGQWRLVAGGVLGSKMGTAGRGKILPASAFT